MSRYKPYPKYRESGVEWLSTIPDHWHVSALKYWTIIKTGYAFSSNDFQENGIPVLRIGDIKNTGDIDFSNAKFLSDSFLFTNHDVIVKYNDIVMAMTGATIGKTGKYTLSTPALLNQRVCIFRTINTNSQPYVWYTLQSSFYLEYINLYAFGGAQPNISDSTLLSFPALLPPLSEQTTIANFLDRETAKIDTLIDKQQRLIELLKEKRQAVISHAVTKGLDPNVKMKDSGVEWLGEVPEHWEVKKLKFNLHLRTEKVKIKGQKVIALENIESNTGKYVQTESTYQGEDVACCRHDILFGKLRPYLAKVYRCNENAIAFGDLLAYQPLIGYKSSYAFYALISETFIKIVDSSTYGAKMPRASADFINEMPLPTPPTSEQQQIADYLDTQTTKIDILIEKANQSITLLKERRTALISAAVTGKIDVREAVV